MKRILILTVALSLMLGLHAQAPTETDTTQSQPLLKVDLGLEVGVSLLSHKATPYASTRCFSLRIPLMAHLPLSPHWQLNAGLRYDFEWAPLRYNVELAADGSLAFLSTPTTSRQHAVMHNSYVGIPIQMVWYPWGDNQRLLGVGLDIYAAYAVSSYINIDYRTVTTDANITYVSESGSVIDAYDPVVQPWKLEVGLTLSTDVIGLLHGVRFFTNLLPTYKDPTTGKKIYTTGITFFL